MNRCEQARDPLIQGSTVREPVVHQARHELKEGHGVRHPGTSSKIDVGPAAFSGQGGLGGWVGVPSVWSGTSANRFGGLGSR